METKKHKKHSAKPTAKVSSTLQRKAKGKPFSNAITVERLTKTSILIDHLSKARGSTLVELQAATGWQAHSVHGFMAGTLKKKGMSVGSEGKGAERRYRLLNFGAQP